MNEAREILRPYGDRTGSTLEAPAWAADYKVAAIERARRKLTDSRTELPIEADKSFLISLVFMIVLVVGLLMFMATTLGTNSPHLLLVYLFSFGISGVQVFRFWRMSSLQEPDAVVRIWVVGLNQKKWAKADRLRVASDRDGFPLRVHGSDADEVTALVDAPSTEYYWKSLFRFARATHSKWSVQKAKVTMITQDLALVRFKLGRFNPHGLLLVLALIPALGLLGLFMFLPASNKSAAFALLDIPYFGLIAVLVPIIVFALFLVLRRGRAISIQKLVVFRSGQWRLFNGEWMGPEEADTSWLDALNPPR